MSSNIFLKESLRDGVAHATGLPLLASHISVLTLPLPGVNPALVYDGAVKLGLDAQAIRKLSYLELADLMFV